MLDSGGQASLKSARSALENKRNIYGRADHCEEFPLHRAARTGRLLVVRLRQIRQPALLRRLSQGRRLFAGEIYRLVTRAAGVVRLQTERRQTVLRRLPHLTLNSCGVMLVTRSAAP